MRTKVEHVNGAGPISGPMRTVVFIRAEGWYPMDIPVTDSLAEHARLNPGTIRIEDLVGRVLWPAN